MDNEEKTENLNEQSDSAPQEMPVQKPKKKGKGCLIAILVVVAILVAIGIGFAVMVKKAESLSTVNTSITANEIGKNSPKWAIYMYCCGSDLEAKNGYATRNLAQIEPSKMPSNLTFVIESGGTKEWQNNNMKADKIQRWTLSNAEGLVLREELPQANMAEKDTFESFLAFCKEKYPAEKTMLIVWDHGAGICKGACIDQNYPDTKLLRVDEMAQALDRTFGSDINNPPLDIINFDCCNMAMADIAYALRNNAKYMIASEETIPGSGQDYAGFVDEIYNNPDISPLDYAKTIVDHYKEKYNPNHDDDTNVTLSVIDLSKIENLNTKLDAFAGELIGLLYDGTKPYAFSNISLLAANTEAYGTNSRVVNAYSNMIDIVDFAEKNKDELPSSKELTQAVKDAVVKQYAGKYHDRSGGISMYYSFNADKNELQEYFDQGSSEGVKAFSELHVNNELSGGRKDFVEKLGKDTAALPTIKTFATVAKSDPYPVAVNKDGQYYCDFGPDVGAATVSAMTILYCYAPDGTCYLLGTDDEIGVNFSEGIFTNEFGGKWLQVGNWVAAADLSYDSDEYNRYDIAIAFEGDDNLYLWEMIYDFEENNWTSTGYSGATSTPGASRKYKMNEGDEFEIVQTYFDEEGKAHRTVVGTEKYREDIISYKTLPDGEYGMAFVLEDCHKNRISSQEFRFTLKDGEITYHNK